MKKIEFLRPGPASLHSNMESVSSRRARLISNPVADGLLCDMKPSTLIQGIGPVCVLPVVAYPPKNSSMGDSIEYSARPYKYHLDTRAFKGEKGIAIAFDSFKIRIDEDWTIIEPLGAKRIAAFPQESCWAGMDHGTGVPTLADLSQRRFALRADGARIGLIVRYFGHEGASRSDIFMHHRPSFLARAIVETDAQVIPIARLSQR